AALHLISPILSIRHLSSNPRIHSPFLSLPCFAASLPPFFFFNDTATTEIYTLSLHDALPIWPGHAGDAARDGRAAGRGAGRERRSEEHTSELQSLTNLVCRLLLEKKKKK